MLSTVSGLSRYLLSFAQLLMCPVLSNLKASGPSFEARRERKEAHVEERDCNHVHRKTNYMYTCIYNIECTCVHIGHVASLSDFSAKVKVAFTAAVYSMLRGKAKQSACKTRLERERERKREGGLEESRHKGEYRCRRERASQDDASS